MKRGISSFKITAYFFIILFCFFAIAAAQDNDNDEIDDSLDNCYNIYNPDQNDCDSDGKGDPCDLINDGVDCPCVLCNSDSPEGCNEDFKVDGDENKKVTIYQNYPFPDVGEKNAAIVRAIIVVHGVMRTANDSFQAIYETVEKEKYDYSNYPETESLFVNNTLIIAPRFVEQSETGFSYKCKATAPPECNESEHCQYPDPNLEMCEFDDQCDNLYWEDGRWKLGYSSHDPSGTRSFQVVDQLLDKITSGIFPNLKTIVITGHSAGGQFTHRYAGFNPKDPDAMETDEPEGNYILQAPDIDIYYAPANPGKYTYLYDDPFDEGLRPVPNRPLPGELEDQFAIPSSCYDVCTECTTCSAWDEEDPPNCLDPYIEDCCSECIDGDFEDCEVYANRDNPDPNQTIQIFDYYNNYQYGLENIPSSIWYATPNDPTQKYTKRYTNRDVFHLLGDADTKTTKDYFPRSCRSILQGYNRYDRGVAFFNYLEYLCSNCSVCNDCITNKKHQKVVVPGAWHNRDLIYQSNQGLSVLFNRLISYCSDTELPISVMMKTKKQANYLLK